MERKVRGGEIRAVIDRLVMRMCVCALAVVVACGVVRAERGEVCCIAVPETSVGAFGFDLELDEYVYRVELRRHTVRGEGFRVLREVGKGKWVEADPGEVSTYRGSVAGVAGSLVCAWLEAGGVHAEVHFPGEDEAVLIEPERGGAGLHRVWRGAAAVSELTACGGVVRGALEEARGAVAGCGGELCVAELACDTDAEFVNRWGANTVVRIEGVINNVNVQFERDAGIRHEITTILIRDGGIGSDPYSATEAGEVLTEFSTEWETAQVGVARDVALLFSGKDFDGTVVGRAFLQSVCGLGYAIVQDLSVFSRLTDLTAHELGHTWGASHCTCGGDATTGYTMNETVTGANRFNPTATIPTLIASRNGKSCLEGLEAGTGPVPFGDDFEGFAAPGVDLVLWTGIDGGVSSTLGLGEPSGTQSLRIQGDSDVRSARLDYSDQQGATVRYWMQRGGGGTAPGAGVDLVVEIRDANGAWAEIARHDGTGTTESVFTEYAHALDPAVTQHDAVRLRFRGEGGGAGDWFIDDVAIESGLALPGSAVLQLPVNGSIGASTDAALQWSGAAFADRYRLLVDDDPVFGSPLVDMEVVTPGFVPAGGWPAGVTLYWSVLSINDAGATGSSPAVASFTVAGQVPEQFTLVSPGTGAVVATTTPTLVWNPSVGAQEYRVLVDRFFDFFAPLVDETVMAGVGSGTVSFEVPGGLLEDGQLYYWQIRAVNPSGSRVSSPTTRSMTVDLAAGCEGDADGSGAVDVNDLSFVLFRLGEVGEGDGADVDGDGSVSVNDISFVLFRLGACL